jgi:excinuclease UvrABC nuclease subunit
METMLSKVVDTEIIVTDSEVEALILESNLIKKLKPRYNINLKDDKSYPYVVITNEPFPRVFVTRQIRKDGSRYFGPYTDVKNVRGALKAVRDIFMIRAVITPSMRRLFENTSSSFVSTIISKNVRGRARDLFRERSMAP